jgi:hypothetical protein
MWKFPDQKTQKIHFFAIWKKKKNQIAEFSHNRKKKNAAS